MVLGARLVRVLTSPQAVVHQSTIPSGKLVMRWWQCIVHFESLYDWTIISDDILPLLLGWFVRPFLALKPYAFVHLIFQQLAKGIPQLALAGNH